MDVPILAKTNFNSPQRGILINWPLFLRVPEARIWELTALLGLWMAVRLSWQRRSGGFHAKEADFFIERQPGLPIRSLQTHLMPLRTARRFCRAWTIRKYSGGCRSSIP